MSSGLDRALIAIDEAVCSDSVITDRDVLETYAHDESDMPGVLPDALVRARSAAEVSVVLREATSHGVPVTPRAAGTGRVGGAIPIEGGIVLCLEGMDQVLDVQEDDGFAVVQPGLITGDLHRLVEERSLFYPPDPNSWKSCQVGGNIATNAGGPRAYKYGVTREYVLGLEVVTAEGSILELGRRTRKGVTGYDLTALMVGSEGTLGVITQATLRVVRKPEAVATLLVLLDSDDATERVLSALERERLSPRCAELLDATTLNVLRKNGGAAIPTAARAMLIVEFDGNAEALDGEIERAGNVLDDLGALDVLVAKNTGERERLWEARRNMSYSMRKLAAHKVSEDVSVPRSALASLLHYTVELSERHELQLPSYGHAGDGNLHVNLLYNDESEHRRVESAVSDLFEYVVQVGGTLTGEHGLGAAKAPYLGLEQSSEVIAMQQRIKTLFDPRGILNPW